VSGSPATDPAEPPDPYPTGPARVRRRRQRWLLGGVVTVVVLGTGGVVAFSRLQRVPVDPVRADPPRATATVAMTDLVERIAASGTVGYGAPHPVAGRKAGTLTWLPRPGTVVDRGGRLYAVDATPVVMIIGDTPMYRTLASGVTAGPDVLILKRNLHALGYEVGKLDSTFRASTTRAIKRWQRALKLPETGRIDAGDVVVLPAAVRVDEVTAQLGGSAQAPVLTVTGIGRLVTVELDESQRGFARPGAKADVDLPGGRSATVTVDSVGSANGDDDKQPKLEVTASFDDAAVATGTDAGPVTVRFTGARRDDVLAVPVQALLALREGGYGIEAADGDQRYVAVELGLFADGLVEVSGAGLTEGMRVVSAG
jgi:peptidoglycan hydrolase-like protein with peptidoglycan-binding domain